MNRPFLKIRKLNSLDYAAFDTVSIDINSHCREIIFYIKIEHDQEINPIYRDVPLDNYYIIILSAFKKLKNVEKYFVLEKTPRAFIFFFSRKCICI